MTVRNGSRKEKRTEDSDSRATLLCVKALIVETKRKKCFSFYRPSYLACSFRQYNFYKSFFTLKIISCNVSTSSQSNSHIYCYSIDSFVEPPIVHYLNQTTNMTLKQLTPELELFSDFEPKKINVLEYTKGKKVIIIGLPGAFTPTW